MSDDLVEQASMNSPDESFSMNEVESGVDHADNELSNMSNDFVEQASMSSPDKSLSIIKEETSTNESTAPNDDLMDSDEVLHKTMTKENTKLTTLADLGNRMSIDENSLDLSPIKKNHISSPSVSIEDELSSIDSDEENEHRNIDMESSPLSPPSNTLPPTPPYKSIS